VIRTSGLSHISLAVRDAERSRAFYAHVFGAVEVYREPGRIDVQTPSRRDVIVFVENAANPGEMGGIAHFGFHLVDPKDVDKAVSAVATAGGTLVSRGDFAPGVPYAFVRDPDGYLIEIWYESAALAGDLPGAGTRRRSGRSLIRLGTIIFLLGTGPLFLVILLSKLGVGDPNPNPIGPGLLGLLTFCPSVFMVAMGVVRLREERRQARV
jgi:catechol 2,3-dioxygenase-like lactoylglutathione lyase family enzyme